MHLSSMTFGTWSILHIINRESSLLNAAIVEITTVFWDQQMTGYSILVTPISDLRDVS